jgi:hypothetical protein
MDDKKKDVFPVDVHGPAARRDASRHAEAG